MCGSLTNCYVAGPSKVLTVLTEQPLARGSRIPIHLMDRPDLLAETHQLMKQLLEIEQQAQTESQKFKEDLDKKQGSFEKFQVSETGAKLEAKMTRLSDVTTNAADQTRESEAQFRERVLAELSRQTELLEQIAEALKA